MTRSAERPRRVSLIAAMARNRVIGAQGRIPWRLPDELQLFKRLTLGHHIIMGRKTYESIGRLLPGRTTIVVSRQPSYSVEGATVVPSLEEALARAADDDEAFVIGGAELFRDALPLADRLHLTLVDAEPDGDVLMPPVDLAEWRERARERHEADQRHAHAYTYVLYERQ